MKMWGQLPSCHPVVSLEHPHKQRSGDVERYIIYVKVRNEFDASGGYKGNLYRLPLVGADIVTGGLPTVGSTAIGNRLQCR